MGLLSDLSFIVAEIRVVIRHAIGNCCRIIGDYLLRDLNPQADPQPDPPRDTPEQEPENKPPDLSKYAHKGHSAFQVAARGILHLLLTAPVVDIRMTVRSIEESLAGTSYKSTQSTIRAACKTMVEDGILNTLFEDKSYSFGIEDKDLAEKTMEGLSTDEPELPDASRESNPGLN